MPVTCPQLRHISNDDQCLENFAGLGSTAYIFLKDDIDKSKLVATKNVYAWQEDTFKTGKGFYKVELKEESQSFSGESLGKRKGYKITAQMVIEVLNDAVSELCRGLNNLDWGVILSDGEGKYQIMYSPTQKVTMDSGAVKTETGAASSDDRTCTLAPVLSNLMYPAYWVTFPEVTETEGEGTAEETTVTIQTTPDDYVLSA